MANVIDNDSPVMAELSRQMSHGRQSLHHTNTGVRLALLECSAFASKLCSRFFMCICITRYFDFT